MSSPSIKSIVGWSPGLVNVENQVKALIDAAEANIERLTAQIRELTSLREKERSVVAVLRLMIVPIGKLPTELLVEIFKIVVQTPATYPPFVTPSYAQGYLWSGASSAALRKVLCLSQVSPYWRQIVHNAPHLWAQGFVDIRLRRELTDAYLSGLKTFITRSAPHPISISLHRGSEISLHRGSENWKKRASLMKSLGPIADILVPTVSRLKNLDIDLDSFDQFNNLPSGSFEALEKLYIRDFSEQTRRVTVFRSSPRLQNFTLETLDGTKIRLIQLPWWQLTQLWVEDDSLGGCRAAFLQCTHLISARFRTSSKWDLTPEAMDSPVVVLPFLETLVMIFDRASASGAVDGGFGAFLMPLSLPSLKQIDFQFNSDDEEFWETDVFSEFQLRSPKIEEIALMFTTIEPEGLIALLRHGPSLAKLDIQFAWGCIDDDVFDTLRYDITDPAPVAPKLREMHLWCIGEFNLDSFEDAIRSRWWRDGDGNLPNGSPHRVSRLKKVSIDVDDDGGMPDELKDQMQDLIRQGLDLHVGWRRWNA
ncbi:hypothetical protein B0H19DRAFT_1384438 [Mycena capillaripes]|nr:hypothetical protein B0H19DRAFT_1384438 [Mycena capillaripes]